MSNLSLNLNSPAASQPQRELRAVWVFSLITLILSAGLLLLLPGYAGPAIIVFIPTVLAAVLIRYTTGRGQVRQRLFSHEQWHISLKWLLITLALVLVIRVGVSLAGLLLVADYQFQPGIFTPFLLIVFIFAAGEEIGWRGFALPTMLSNGYHPLSATLLLAVPWALLHLPLTLPGMISAGTPVAAEFLIILALAVLTSWIYLAGGRSLTAAVLLHGGQNMLAFLNTGLDPVATGWLMAAVYGAAAILVILFSRGRLGLPAGRKE